MTLIDLGSSILSLAYLYLEEGVDISHAPPLIYEIQAILEQLRSMGMPD